MKGFAVLLVFLSITLATVYGRPSGAPQEACDNLTPQHGNNQPRTDPSPYILDISGFEDPPNSNIYYYTPGEPYELRLYAPPDAMNTFRGFLVQSRTDGSRAGRFEIDELDDDYDDKQIGPCMPDNSSITHTNNMDKTSISMYWIAPPAGTGTIQFVYTVVQETAVFWVVNEGTHITENNRTEVTCVQECGMDEVCVTEEGMRVCVCSGYVFNPSTGYCSLPTVTCTLDCGMNGTCTVTDEGMQECVCSDGYVQNPNTGGCVAEVNCNLECGMNEVCVTEEGMQVCVCIDGYMYNPNTGYCEVNCTLVCGINGTCIVTEAGMQECVCSDGYVYNPNSGYCEMGQVELPIHLDPTVIDYSGNCTNLNTTIERYEIYDVVRETLVKSVVYNDDLRP